MLVELRVGGLSTNSFRIENGFVMCISSRELVSGSDPRRSMLGSPRL